MTNFPPDKGSCEKCCGPVPQTIWMCWACYEEVYGTDAVEKCKKKYLDVYPVDWDEDDVLIGETSR